VDDNPANLRIGKNVLSDMYTVATAPSAPKLFKLLENNHPVLILLDVDMPDIDGYKALELLKSKPDIKDIPVVFLTGMTDSKDEERGRALGAVDYMTKPFDEKELILRIRALQRRAKIARERELRIGKVLLNYNTLSVTRAGQSFTLPPKEFYLLFKLLSYPGIIFTRLQLMDEIWGLETETDDRSVNVHVCRLRERFQSYPEFEILTMRNLGYKAEVRA